MRHALVVVAVLVLTATPSGHASVRAEVGPAIVAAVSPAERLLIVVTDAAAPPDEPILAGLATGLRLADPAATVIVLPRGGATRTVGPFLLRWSLTLSVETATGLPFSVDLGPKDALSPVGVQVTVVEVLGGPEGISAWRVGDLTPSPVELRLPAWRPPGPGVDAVALDGAWWSLAPEAGLPVISVRAHRGLRARLARTPVSRLERLVDASVGDVTGDGVADLALSFRRPFQRTMLNVARPRRAWVDADGLSAHVGLFRPDDLSSIWVAGTLVRPVHRLAACTGALAVTYSTLRRPEVVAATAWAWQGFGFLPLPELSGTGRPSCIDIDRDGRPDAAIIERG